MKQLFINVIGHNASGKTTVAKRLEQDLGFNRVSGDDFRQFIHEHIAYFTDTDLSYPNERYDLLNPLVIDYRQALSWLLLKAGQSVLFDGSGSKSSFRAKYLDKVAADFPDVVRIILWANIAESELLERLKQRGGKWQQQYEDLKKHGFEPPTAREADMVLRYDQHNYEEILSSLRGLLR